MLARRVREAVTASIAELVGESLQVEGHVHLGMEWHVGCGEGGIVAGL